MYKNRKFGRGVGVGMVTPFTRDDQVDEEGIRKNISFYLKNGVHSITACSTSGEGSLLSVEEYEKVIKILLNCVNGKVKVKAGCPGTSPYQIIKRIKLVKNLGVDGAHLSTPPYVRPTQEGLYAHFSKILNSVDFPISIYNAVHRSAVDMDVSIVERLANEYSNFTAYKEPALRKLGLIKLSLGDRLSLGVEDWLFLPGLAIGAHRVASVAVNVVPKMMVDIYDNFIEGKLEKAREIQLKLIPLMTMLGSGGGGMDRSPSPIKAAMNMIGLAGGYNRLPLVSASEETKKGLKNILIKLIPEMKVN